MLRTWSGLLLAALVSLVIPKLALADEPLFGFSYTTDLLPKGKWEVEQWSTTRFAKASGKFWEQSNRTEVEYGVTDRFQFSLYANYDSTTAFRNGPFGVTTPPEQFSYDTPGPNDRYHRSRYIGTSGEAIFRILSPYRHSIGLALYEEPTIGAGFIESETRLIAQKNYQDDRLVIAANFTYAPEWRRDPDSKTFGYETDVNVSTGVTYRFRPSWSLGAELINEREFNSYVFQNLTNSGYYLGPTVHYGGKHFFATATFVEQMPWANTHSATVPGTIVGGRDYDNDFEKFRARLRFGWYF